MKTIKKQIKVLSLFLSILILFQGCSVYHKGTITIDQAVKEQEKVKITTQDNRSRRFKKIVLKDGKYYGVKKINDSTKDVWLFENDIVSINNKNKTLSTVLNIGFPLIIIGLFYLAVHSESGGYL